MGLCASTKKEAVDEEQKLKSQELTREIMADEIKDRELNKFLLIGPGESGKSTLFKQMISLYGKGFSESDRHKYIPLIHLHILNCIKTLCKQTEVLHAQGIPGTLMEAKNQESWKIIQRVKEVQGPLSPELGPHMAALWADPGIQQTLEHRTLYYLTDSSEYFLNKVEQVLSPQYFPSEQDIFRCRTRSTGILEESFEIEGNKFKMMDVGGQRNERKKWIHCFSGVTALLFVVAMSEYDMVLFEDGKTNRMEEALNVFEEVVNNEFMINIPVMLFLNKRDLFQEKLLEKKVPLTGIFPDFKITNPDDLFNDATTYIRKQFEKRNKNPTRKVYSLVTCATDPDNVKFVFRSVNDIVIKRALTEGGLTEASS